MSMIAGCLLKLCPWLLLKLCSWLLPAETMSMIVSCLLKLCSWLLPAEVMSMIVCCLLKLCPWLFVACWSHVHDCCLLKLCPRLFVACWSYVQDCLLPAEVMSQQQYVSLGQICFDDLTCHTETEDAHHTSCLFFLAVYTVKAACEMNDFIFSSSCLQP